ncbi:DUF6691 family protein [Novosphingobium sp.]|uniref:DUF6691 family protein n=1 Tax=Novosphingobium sp. TaxID=1874826 RepID=UPI0035B03F61
MRQLIALASGLVFGLGLAISGMTSPDKVVGFLDVTGAWNPALAFVMGGALLVATPIYWLAARRGTALCGDALGEPGTSAIDRKLVIGSVLFGAGWGLVGLCPGPALLDFFAQPVAGGVFCAAMIAGLLLSRRD